MSMLTLNGTVMNVFTSPKGTKKSGEEYGGDDRVQLMAEQVLQNGEKRIELVNLKVDNAEAYRAVLNKSVRVPVGVFASANNLIFFVPKGALPESIQ